MKLASPLDAEAVRAALRGHPGAGRFAAGLEVHGTIASTSDRARELAEGGAADGTLVVADRQTAGRGRQGRVWFSPPGRNLYVTAVLRPRLALDDAPVLTLAAAVALREAVAALTGLDPRVKWPNDLQLDGRKCAGILTEMSLRGRDVGFVLVGVGVNVNLRAQELPDELAGRATTLATALGRELSRPTLLAELCASLDTWVARLQAEGPPPILAAWRAFAAHLGARVRYAAEDGPCEGIALDVDDRGALIVERDDGSRGRVLAGEIETLG